MKKTLSYFTILLLFLIPSLAVSEEPSIADPIYTIGAILPLTGEAASVGTFAKRSIQLAYDSLEPALKEKIHIVYEDDAMDPKRSIAAYQMLTSTKKINAVIAMTSGIGHALASHAERDEVLTIVAGASDKTFAAGKEFVFIHWVSPEMEAGQMVNEIKQKGYRRIAMVSHIQQGVEAYNRVFKDLMKEAGLADRIIFDESVAIGSNDFNTILTKMRAAKPDAIFLGMFSEGLSTIARRIKEMSLPGEIFGAEFFEDEHVVKASQGALLHSWYVNIDDPDKRFVTEYQSRYKEYPGLAAANCYDSLKLIAEGAAQFGTDNKKISNYLKTLHNYHGATGTYSATDDNRFSLRAAIKVVTENGFEKVNR